MTAAEVPRPAAPRRGWRGTVPLPGRLLRLELRRSAMPWLLPVLGALFWWGTYRSSMNLVALWSLRSSDIQDPTC